MESKSKGSFKLIGGLAAVIATSATGFYVWQSNLAEQYAASVQPIAIQNQQTVENETPQAHQNAVVTNTSQGDNSAVHDQIAALQQQINAINTSLVDAKAVPPAAEQDETTLPTSSGLMEEYHEMVVREQEQARQQEQLIVTTFESQIRDEAWSGGIEDKIAASFDQPELAGGRLRASDCRSTMCYVEFEVSNVDDSVDPAMIENHFLMAVSDDLPGGAMKSAPDGNGNLVYSVYFAKDGHSLPAQEETGPTG